MNPRDMTNGARKIDINFTTCRKVPKYKDPWTHQGRVSTASRARTPLGMPKAPPLENAPRHPCPPVKF
ncbi:hypothetical protein K449DRAFT_268663 [Hypoxylon sp. EC38]|nr:hypothetical protein K449DRAFT_268663 [Hypoxylon sp. EC38]